MTKITSTEKKTRKKLAIHWQILIGIGLGVVFGIVMTKFIPYEAWSPYIKWAGDMFLRGLNMIVIPLVFSSIALGVAGMGDSKALGRIAGKTFAFYIVTTLIAATIGLTLVNIVKPGVGADLKLTENVTDLAGTQVSFIDQIVHIVPANIFESLSTGNLLSIIFFAIIFGFFINMVDQKQQTTLKDILQAIYDVIMKVTLFIIKLAPYGVFAIVANVVGKQAGDTKALLDIAGSLGIFVLIVWGGLLIHGGI
nr:cation:dicarboxylase symporter family transporter [Bacteroidales bacterium]